MPAPAYPAMGYNGRRCSKPVARPTELRWLAPDDPPANTLVAHSLSKRALSLALLEDQGRILELLARGASLNTVFRALVLAVEALSGDMLCSVLLLDQDGKHLKHASAPSLPRRFCKALDSRRPPMVVDIATDPHWAACRKLALNHGLPACWSSPIQSPRAEVLGALALYYRAPREPMAEERQLVDMAAELAALAIAATRGPAAVPSHARPRVSLSPRELQIVRFIAEAQPIKRIASRLGVTISTVYTHRARIFEKLGVKSNVALARYALAHRLCTEWPARPM